MALRRKYANYLFDKNLNCLVSENVSKNRYSSHFDTLSKS